MIEDRDAQTHVVAAGMQIPDVDEGYETPELVELGQATALVRGNVYTKYYQDCGENGTTDYRPTC